MSQIAECSITIQGNLSYISGQYPLDVVKKATSYFVSGFQFSRAYKSHKWDGKKHLFNRTTKSFPAGLTETVREAIHEFNRKIRVRVIDHRGPGPVTGGHGFELKGIDFGKGKYDYQIKSAQAMVDGRRGVIKLATNAGKTEVACAVTQHLALPTLFLVERLELLKQTRKRFAKRLGISEDEIGLIGDGEFSVGVWITVATPASLKSRLAKGEVDPTRFDVVFCDECHHVAADTFYDVLCEITAHYRFGMSGTPLDRTDGSDIRLLAQTGPVLYEVSNKLLVERGISVPPHVKMVRIDKPEYSGRGLTWNQVECKGVTENEHLNEAVAEHAIEQASAGANVLVLVEKIKHGKAIHQLLSGEVTRRFISGKEDTDTRSQVLQEFEDGGIQVLIATSILDEGVDVPCIDVLILAAGGKAKIRLLQRVGRGLRQNEGKERLLVIDFANYTHKWLLKHSLARLRMYRAEECFMISEG